VRISYLLALALVGAAIAQSPPAASPVDGVWLGTLHTGGGDLRIQLRMRSDPGGQEKCELDSLDQGAMGLPCANVKLKGEKLSFDVPVVHGQWFGSLKDDGRDLDGTWSQGMNLPLKLSRQAASVEPKTPEPPKCEAAMAAVSLSDLKSVLDRDLAEALKTGPLEQGRGAAMVIGVTRGGVRRVLVYGGVPENSIFEIGSISKTFTGLILAQMVEQGKVPLDEPVRQLLTQRTVAKPWRNTVSASPRPRASATAIWASGCSAKRFPFDRECLIRSFFKPR